MLTANEWFKIFFYATLISGCTQILVLGLYFMFGFDIRSTGAIAFSGLISHVAAIAAAVWLVKEA